MESIIFCHKGGQIPNVPMQLAVVMSQGMSNIMVEMEGNKSAMLQLQVDRPCDAPVVLKGHTGEVTAVDW